MESEFALYGEFPPENFSLELRKESIGRKSGRVFFCRLSDGKPDFPCEGHGIDF
jgi:hypothetical protein